MEVQPEPPIFVLAEDCYRVPLIFVARDLNELDTYFREHADSEPVPEGEIRVTSRFFDVTGRRWSHEGGGSSGGALVPTTEGSVSQQDLRDTVIRAHTELVRFYLESQDFAQTALDLAEERNFSLPKSEPPPTSGPERHRAYHEANNIPAKRSHN